MNIYMFNRFFNYEWKTFNDMFQMTTTTNKIRFRISSMVSLESSDLQLRIDGQRVTFEASKNGVVASAVILNVELVEFEHVIEWTGIQMLNAAAECERQRLQVDKSAEHLCIEALVRVHSEIELFEFAHVRERAIFDELYPVLIKVEQFKIV